MCCCTLLNNVPREQRRDTRWDDNAIQTIKLHNLSKIADQFARDKYNTVLPKIAI